jgi:hypothetical protein
MNPYEQTKAAIRALDGPEGITRNFHLSPCGGCGQPVWQQPCPLCGYYPMGSDPRERERCQKMDVTRDDWLRYAKRAGDVAQWYLEGFTRTVAWSKCEPGFRDKVCALIEQAKDLGLSDDAEVYEAAMADWNKKTPTKDEV